MNTELKTLQLDENAKMVVTELVGQHALIVVDFLKDKEKISEFIIAEELDMEINNTRNILYKLLEHNIVSFIRRKDRIKGWYICYWDFNPSMVPHLKYKILLEKQNKLKERLNAETCGQYYICTHACSRMTFEDAVEQNFKCTECGTIMQEQDNTRTKEFLVQRIAELDKEIKRATPERKIAYEEEIVVKIIKETVSKQKSAVKTPVKKAVAKKSAIKKVVAKKAPVKKVIAKKKR